MHVVRRSGNPYSDRDNATTESLTFGAVDVSWTPPLQNVFVCDNESWC